MRLLSLTWFRFGVTEQVSGEVAIHGNLLYYLSVLKDLHVVDTAGYYSGVSLSRAQGGVTVGNEGRVYYVSNNTLIGIDTAVAAAARSSLP